MSATPMPPMTPMHSVPGDAARGSAAPRALERRAVRAAEALASAEAAGMRLRLTPDGRVRMEATLPPQPGLLAALREWREEVVDLLARRATAADPQRASGSSGSSGGAMDHDAAEAAALAAHFAAPAAPRPYDPADPDPLRDGLLLGARMRPPAWGERGGPPPKGAWCSCCGRHEPMAGGRWWAPRAAADGGGPAPGWRCWTCHPPVEGWAVIEVRR